MNRSLIELTRYALGRDFLVRRIEREVIESTAKELLPLFEKVTVEEGLLEKVVDELCKEQSEKLQEGAVDVLESNIKHFEIPEVPSSHEVPTIESISVYDAEFEHINDIDKIDQLVDEYEGFKSEMTSAREDFESYMDKIAELIDNMDDVIDEADDIIMKLDDRKYFIEEDEQK